MYLKRYTVASFVLMLLIGWYVYSFVTQESMSLSLFGYKSPSLPVALLVVLPLFILYLASVLHMGFYSILGSIKLKKYEKDYNKLLSAISDAFLQKDQSSRFYNTPRYSLLGKIVENSKIFPNTEPLINIEDEKLKKTVEIIDKIQKGESVNLKKFSLSPNNPFVIQNIKNRLKSKEISPEEILKNSQNYDESIVKYAFEEYIKIAKCDDILKYKNYIDSKNIFDILQRVNDDENAIEFSNEEYIDLLQDLGLTKDEYIKVAKKLSKNMVPDSRLKIFEKLSEKDENATPAYLYTAFDVEMIELAKEILDASSQDEYKNFKAFLALRECGKNFSIDLFV